MIWLLLLLEFALLFTPLWPFIVVGCVFALIWGQLEKDFGRHRY